MQCLLPIWTWWRGDFPGFLQLLLHLTLDYISSSSHLIRSTVPKFWPKTTSTLLPCLASILLCPHGGHTCIPGQRTHTLSACLQADMEKDNFLHTLGFKKNNNGSQEKSANPKDSSFFAGPKKGRTTPGFKKNYVCLSVRLFVRSSVSTICKRLAQYRSR